MSSKPIRMWSGGLIVGIIGAMALTAEAQQPVTITNVSTTVTEAATVTANQSTVALTDSVLYAYDGSTDSRLRSRAGLINSADVGLVTRPFMGSDGTNTMPTMDAAARAGIVKPPVATPVLANALSTTVTTVAGAPATLDSYYCWNPNSSVAYVQVFDISGAVTLGVSTPKWSMGIPPTAGANLSNVNLTFANAVKVAATTTATGSTATTTPLDCNFGTR